MKFSLTYLIALGLVSTHLTLADTTQVSETKTGWTSAEELLEVEKENLSPEEAKLQKTILQMRKEIEQWGAVNYRTYQRLKRLIKDKTPSEIYMIERAVVLGTERENVRPEPVGEIEEVVVTWQPFKDLPSDPEEFSVREIKTMRGIRGLANQWYREGDYALAYPILLELAKRGFKDAQSRLAYILFNGADEVEKSNLRALGWLGASAHGRTEPAFKVLFNKYLRQVPDEHRPIVDSVIAKYQEAFSHSEHLDCSIEHPYAEGVVKRVYCRFKLEAIADAQRGMRSWVDKVNSDDEI